MCDQLGGEVERSERREFGRAFIDVSDRCHLFEGLWAPGAHEQVWMSHGDRVATLPPGFRAVAHTEDAPQEEPCTPACGKQYVGEHHSEHCPHFDGGPDDAQPADAAQPAEAACEMRRKAETAIENAAFVTSDKYEYLARAILTYLGTYAAPPKEELSDDIPTRAGDPSDCDATPLPRLSEADEHRFSEAD